MSREAPKIHVYCTDNILDAIEPFLDQTLSFFKLPRGLNQSLPCQSTTCNSATGQLLSVCPFLGCPSQCRFRVQSAPLRPIILRHIRFVKLRKTMKLPCPNCTISSSCSAYLPPVCRIVPLSLLVLECSPGCLFTLMSLVLPQMHSFWLSLLSRIFQDFKSSTIQERERE